MLTIRPVTQLLVWAAVGLVVAISAVKLERSEAAESAAIKPRYAVSDLDPIVSATGANAGLMEAVHT